MRFIVVCFVLITGINLKIILDIGNSGGEYVLPNAVRKHFWHPADPGFERAGSQSPIGAGYAQMIRIFSAVPLFCAN